MVVGPGAVTVSFPQWVHLPVLGLIQSDLEWVHWAAPSLGAEGVFQGGETQTTPIQMNLCLLVR